MLATLQQHQRKNASASMITSPIMIPIILKTPLNAKKERPLRLPEGRRNERSLCFDIQFLGSAFDCIDHSRDQLEHQCEAANDSSYDHIQNEDPDSASQIKSMRHEPKEHATNAEG